MLCRAGEVIFGKWGGRILGIGMVAKSVGLASSHVLAGKIAISVFDNSKHCSVIWAVVVAVICRSSLLSRESSAHTNASLGTAAGLSYSRKWSGLTWLSVLSLTCIFTASMITVVGVAVQDNSRLIKNDVPIHWEAFATENVSVMSVVGALLNTVFSVSMLCLTLEPARG